MLKMPRVDEQVMNLKDIEKLFNERIFKRTMEYNISHILRRTGKKTSFSLTTKTSDIYTNGEKIVVGLPDEYKGMQYGEIYSMVKACVGHESAHVKWSNFNSIKPYLQEVSKRNISTSLGHSMFNIIEDGRIERLLCEEFPGYTKHVKFLNLKLIMKDGNLKKSSSELCNIIGIIHFLAVLGVYPTNYKDLLGKKEIELIETQIHPLILKGVMTNSYSVAQQVCLDILDLIKDYIPEPKQIPQELIDLLESLMNESYVSSEGSDGEDSSDLNDIVDSIMSQMNSSKGSSSNSQSSSSVSKPSKSKNHKQNDKDEKDSNEEKGSDSSREEEDKSSQEGDSNSQDSTDGVDEEGSNQDGDAKSSGDEAEDSNQEEDSNSQDSTGGTDEEGSNQDGDAKSSGDEAEDSNQEGDSDSQDSTGGTDEEGPSEDGDTDSLGDEEEGSNQEGGSNSQDSTGGTDEDNSSEDEDTDSLGDEEEGSGQEGDSNSQDSTDGVDEEGSNQDGDAKSSVDEEGSNQDEDTDSLGDEEEGSGQEGDSNSQDSTDGVDEDNSSEDEGADSLGDEEEGSGQEGSSYAQDDLCEDSQKGDSNDRDIDSDDNSKPVPNHLDSEDFNIDSSAYEKDENDFLENLKDEINEEAQRAFEKIEKEEQRAKYDIENSYHNGINLDEINSNYSSRYQEPDFEFIYPEYPYAKPQAEFKMKIHGLRKTFEKMLKNDETHYKGQKRGRLDTARLWRLGVDDNAVFKKKTSIDKMDYAVEILIDVSGSMSDRVKYRNAMGTAICVESALTGLEGVEVKTVAFSFSGGSKLRVLKDFSDNESKTPNVYNYNISGGGNRDGFAIRVALSELKKHRAKNKLLVVISDGMPAAIGKTSDEISDVKNAVHEGRKDVTIVSVLINDGPIKEATKRAFVHMYEDKGSIMVDVVNNPEDLIKNIVLYLKRMFKK